MSVSAFKAIQEAKIDLPRLTIFVGENGSGKSSIIHALSILKRSRGTAAINTDLPYANLGPISDLVTAGREASIEIVGTEDSVGLGNSDLTHQLSYTCKVTFDVQGLSKYHAYAECGPFKFSNTWNRYGSQTLPTVRTIDNISFNLLLSNEIGRAFVLRGYALPNAPSNDEENVKTQFHAQSIYNSLDKISLAISRDLERFFVVPPLRGFTESSYSLPQSPNQELLSRTPDSQTQMAANLKYWEANERKISRLLSEVVGVELDIKLERGPSVRVLNAKNGVNFVNEGFGANQLLWVFERIVNSPDQSLIVVEEPETHLHPKAQFLLGKLLSEHAFDTKKLILVSHSPHLLSGILTAVKSKTIAANDVALYFFEKEVLGVQVNRASIDEQGTVTGGLKGFMEAAASELIEYASAGTKP